MAGKGADTKDFLDFVYSFHESMEQHKVLLVYEGEITHQITKAFTSLTENNMEVEEEAHSTQKKVFHVMVECLQNVGKHAENYRKNESRKDGKGAFLLSRTEEDYFITTGNKVNSEKVSEMVEVLEKINSLDRDGLKKLYKLQIREGRLSNKGGAGLGFIDIAKKTGNSLNYKFIPINSDFSFFVLSCKISRNNN